MVETHEHLFLRTVEAGSLKAAAEQSGADPSAVSRKLAALEARLGVKLLNRSTRRSTPTEAGQRYYEGLRRILDEKAALEADITKLVDTPTGRLVVAAPVDFGARFVAPIVAELQDRHPDLEADLKLSSGFADLAEEGIDVAIRIGRLPDSSLIARRLGAVPRVLVASSQYLAAHTAPMQIADLKRHAFVFYQPGQRELDIRIGQQSVTVTGRISANSITAVRALVAAGRGLHLGPVWAFEDGLADGSLKMVLPGQPLEAFPLHAIYRPTNFVPAKVRVFIDAMARAVRQEPSLDQ